MHPIRLKACLLTLGALVAGGAFAQQDALLWRQLAPDNVIVMDLDAGEVVFELNPAFAPRTVERFRELVRGDFYRGLSFYRVIDGFVAQAGDESDIGEPGSWPGLPAEFERAAGDDLAWMPVQQPDLFAPETGFIDGFAAAREGKRAWLVHCPGALAMARGNAPDSGSTDFYIVIGQAPRYLDRNLTIFGRVILGMDVVQAIRRGPTDNNGIIEGDLDRSRIRQAWLASELPAERQRDFFVMDTSSDGFAKMMEARRKRDHEFFHHKPPPVLDVCQVPVGARAEKTSRQANPRLTD